LRARKGIPSAASWNDTPGLDHQHNRALGGARPVHNAFWNHDPLAWRQFNRAALQVDEELSFHDVEELVIVLVLVPVIFALNHSEPHYRVVHFTEGLVVPLVRALVRQRLLVNQLKRASQDIKQSYIRKFCRIAHANLRITSDGRPRMRKVAPVTTAAERWPARFAGTRRIARQNAASIRHLPYES